MKKIPVAVLGGTGMVGQRFIQMLENHPYFELKVICASEQREGKKYGESVKWFIEGHIPKDAAGIPISTITIAPLKKNKVEIAFSALPGDVAKDVEKKFAEEGIKIFTNAHTYRMEKNVPIVIPEVNPEHLALVEQQKTDGYIVTNANCSTTGLVLGLKPLNDKFGIERINVATYQALSGAGYPGVASLDITGNVVPFIRNEEEKMEIEAKKIFGKLSKQGIKYADFSIIASCARVPVRDGHLEAVTVRFKKTPSVEQVKSVMRNFRGVPQKLGLPTAPREPIIVTEEEDRPQPRIDAYAGEPERARGMATTVGRIKEVDGCIRMFLLSHNTIRGAAGTSILTAELAVKEGRV
ncbi:MAG: aspartate-semialdehyde dehydrogenase [Thermoplasmata archaeon]